VGGERRAIVGTLSEVCIARRLGYLLDQVCAAAATEPIHAWVERQSTRPVLLQSGRSGKGATEDRRWRVLVNQHIEADA